MSRGLIEASSRSSMRASFGACSALVMPWRRASLLSASDSGIGAEKKITVRFSATTCFPFMPASRYISLQVVAFTVKRLPKSVVDAFAGAFRYQGKTIQDVMAEIMAEYAERVLDKVSKG